MQNLRVSTVDVARRGDKMIDRQPDLLAVEEPLEIRLVFGPKESRKEHNIALTMRTPGHDFELAIGFLFTESLVRIFSDISTINHCKQVKSDEEVGNVIRVTLKEDVEVDLSKVDRNFYTTSSCGVCGKSSIEALSQSFEYINANLKISEATLLEAPDLMRKEQAVFEHTGGLHAAALFDKEGQLIFLREDIGRHNALDKLIGAALAKDMLPLSAHFVMVSGRIGFELVQKSIAAGVPIMGAVGAPSSLAVKLAESHGMTLAGFVRNGSFNIYSRKERIQ